MTPTDSEVPSKIEMNFQGDYSELWRQADSLEKKGLYRSALAVVQTIDQKAGQDKNIPEQVKALIHIVKFSSYFEEEDQVKAIAQMQQRIEKAEAPLKQILHSVTAQLYWNYFQNNRWKFMNRTATESFDQSDIRTWDLTKLSHEVRDHFLLSLSAADTLKGIQIDNFSAILSNAEKKPVLLPTLYDFLAYEALDFFESASFQLHRPIEEFTVNDARHFATNDVFTQLEFSTPDSLATVYYAFVIHRDLARFHSKDQEPSTRIQTTLRRLNFARSHSTHPEKENFYFAALAKLAEEYPSHPFTSETNYNIALFLNQRGDTYTKDNDTFRLDKKKALQLCEETITKFPEATGANWCAALKSQILSKEVTLQTDLAIYPGASNKLKINYRNIDSLYFRIARIDWGFFIKNRTYGKELIHELTKLPVEKSWSVQLRDFEDYQNHSVLTAIEQIPQGHYVLLSSPTVDFREENNAIAYAGFYATELSVLTKDDPDGNKVYTVLNRKTGAPIKGATIQVYEYNYGYSSRSYQLKKAEKLSTDAEGSAVLKSSGKYRNIYIHVSSGKDEFSDATRHYLSRRYEEKEQTKYTTNLFTDRKIYRPGQKIYFKGILMKHTGDLHEIQPNTTGKVEFYDANYQKVAEMKYTSNAFGSFSGEFEAPKGMLNGTMHIKDANRGAVYFSVEDYKRPKFEVSTLPLEGAYKIGEKVTVKGEAKNFAGSVVDGAKVSYRVTRTMRYPVWKFYRGSYFGAPDQEITNGSTETNDKGEFTIVFDAKKDPKAQSQYSPIYNYTVTIDVTDITGETQSTTQTVAVAEHAMELSFGISETVNRTKRSVFALKSTNLNGQKVSATGTVTIHKLSEPGQLFKPNQEYVTDYSELSESELREQFPYDDFKEARLPENLKREQQIFSTSFSTAESDSIHLNGMEKWKTGRYVLEAKSIDAFGVEVKTVTYFTLYDTGEKTAPTNEFWWVHAEKTSCEPGETAEFIIASAANATQVFVEAEGKTGVFFKKRIVLSNEQQVIRIPVKEEHRGNFAVRFSGVKEGVFYSQQFSVLVPHSNKKLDVTFETFRNKLLPGQKEEWKVKIKGPKGEKVAAEMLAAMYDASLDQFAANSFSMSVFGQFYPRSAWSSTSFGAETAYIYENEWNKILSPSARPFPHLNWFGYSSSHYLYSLRGQTRKVELEEVSIMANATAPQRDKAERDEDGGGRTELISKEENSGAQQDDDKDAASPTTQIRTNLNETAFFYPHLRTNDKGEVLISFTIPEALTRWKFISMAHTKDLKTGFLTEEIVTQKDLMILPNPPRFMREGDQMTFTAKVSNLSDKELKGTAKLELFDALTMQPVTPDFGLTANTSSFSVTAKQSALLAWKINVPSDMGAVVYRVSATAGQFSDGEENALPVLSNRMLVTESLPLPSKGIGSRLFTLDKLLQSGQSNTLSHYQLTLEYTSNPAWYAVQAMPYMMEYPYECAEQIFTRYYANALATEVANSNPKIKQVFDIWKNSSPDAFLSNLEKNQELKSLLLEETPWVMSAHKESERKKRIGLLFDLNRMSGELKTAIRKLEKMQVSNGAWPWFPGMPENRYITQHIVTGLGHLDRLGVKDVRKDHTIWNMTRKAIGYLDERIIEDLERVKKHNPKTYLTEQHISQTQLQYLYARSYFPEIPVTDKLQEAHAYYLKQMQNYWLKFSIQSQAMIALTAHRFAVQNFPEQVLASLKERALMSDEMGMYWKDNTGGYYWYQAPIETQALLIEAFDEVTKDVAAVEEMKVWLLKQKQTTDWKTTKATANAVYALLMRGTDLLANEETVQIEVGGKRVDPSATGQQSEAGTGYFKTSWQDEEIRPEMGQVKVTRTTEGVSWGALYWQYFEDLDKITPHATPLQLEKKLFLVKRTSSGEVMTPVSDQTTLNPGDKIRVRIVLRTDRDLEYVHMKDMRAAGVEPVNVFSQYKYQGGIGYYESTRDAATNFFIDYLRKGTYVFEYDVRANLAGDFSNGITTIQCMYAPEFTSHSKGIRLKIK